MPGLWPRAVNAALRTWKATLSPLLGPACRFAPSCSEYAAQALVEHGPLAGGWLTAKRLCRCRPGGGSGYDPVPPRRDGFKCV